MPAFASPTTIAPPRAQSPHKPLVSSRRPSLPRCLQIGTSLSDTSCDALHPVLEVLKARQQSSSKPGARADGHKVALCIEGGGMRGAIAAGMVAATRYVGMRDAFDVVYGCSAGAIVGAYFVANQVPVYGARIYYDTICAPFDGQSFIDLRAFRHHPFFQSNRAAAHGPTKPPSPPRRAHAAGRPVLLLDRLVDDVMRRTAPLDFTAFQARNAHQPLVPIASSMCRMQSTALRGHASLDTLLTRLRASARVPGIAGDPVAIDGDLFVDGLLFEPIPYRTALADGCTHVLVFRTRSSGCKLPVKPGIYEKLIATPCLARAAGHDRWWRDVADYLQRGEHIARYRGDLRTLTKENLEPGSISGFADASVLSIMPRAPVRVSQLERRARNVFHGVRNGFAVGYDALSPMANGGRGNEHDGLTPGDRVARFVFPDEEIDRVEREHAAQRKAWAKQRSSGRRRWWWHGTTPALNDVSLSDPAGLSVEERLFVG